MLNKKFIEEHIDELEKNGFTYLGSKDYKPVTELHKDYKKLSKRVNELNSSAVLAYDMDSGFAFLK